VESIPECEYEYLLVACENCVGLYSMGGLELGVLFLYFVRFLDYHGIIPSPRLFYSSSIYRLLSL